MSGPVIREWLHEPLPAEVRRAIERLRRASDVMRVALMPDVHLAEHVCVGTVLATSRTVYPQAVGSDIGCGMLAVRMDGPAEVLDDPEIAAAILAGFTRSIPALSRGRRDALEHECTTRHLSDPRLRAVLSRDGPVQLGTLGRGNHFLELQADDDGNLWLMIHSGSRAVGQAVHRHFVEDADGKLVGLDAESEHGRAYLSDMVIALEYAEANRDAILRAATSVIEEATGFLPVPTTLIRCQHNHVRQEAFGSQRLLVHRKGAISAAIDEPGIIPGSMGAPSYLVRGRGCEAALRSSSHGAGRRFSRTEARRRISERDLHRQLAGVWFDHRLSRRLRDEAPSAYKDITKVMRAQRTLTRIERVLHPVLSYKGA